MILYSSIKLINQVSWFHMQREHTVWLNAS